MSIFNEGKLVDAFLLFKQGKSSIAFNTFLISVSETAWFFFKHEQARAQAARASTSLKILLFSNLLFSNLRNFTLFLDFQDSRISKFLDFQTFLTFARAYRLKSFKLVFSFILISLSISKEEESCVMVKRFYFKNYKKLQWKFRVVTICQLFEDSFDLPCSSIIN